MLTEKLIVKQEKIGLIHKKKKKCSLLSRTPNRFLQKKGNDEGMPYIITGTWNIPMVMKKLQARNVMQISVCEHFHFNNSRKY